MKEISSTNVSIHSKNITKSFCVVLQQII